MFRTYSLRRNAHYPADSKAPGVTSNEQHPKNSKLSSEIAREKPLSLTQRTHPPKYVPQDSLHETNPHEKPGKMRWNYWL